MHHALGDVYRGMCGTRSLLEFLGPSFLINLRLGERKALLLGCKIQPVFQWQTQHCRDLEFFRGVERAEESDGHMYTQHIAQGTNSH